MALFFVLGAIGFYLSIMKDRVDGAGLGFDARMYLHDIGEHLKVVSVWTAVIAALSAIIGLLFKPRG